MEGILEGSEGCFDSGRMAGIVHREGMVVVLWTTSIRACEVDKHLSLQLLLVVVCLC